MATKYCEICSLQVQNLKRHLNSKKHKRFQGLEEYSNYGDQQCQQQNNILGNKYKEKGRNFLVIIYMFFINWFYNNKLVR